MAKKTANTKLEKIQKELDRVNEQLKRALADYHNLERRVNQEKQNFSKLSAGVLILKFLPVLDNLKKAAEHIKDDGVKLIIKQFDQILATEDVKEIPALGQVFNPKIHEAVEVVQGNEDDKVVRVVETGYFLGDKVLRPAKVVVSKKTIDQNAEKKAEKSAVFGDYA